MPRVLIELVSSVTNKLRPERYNQRDRVPTSPTHPMVLIVDDDPIVSKTFERVLVMGGFDVVMAHNATDALRMLDQNRPDAIIVDLLMPMVNGLGLLYRIRSLEAHQHLPAIVVTGLNPLPAETLAELATLDIAVRYKPIRGQDLLADARALTRRTDKPA
jgi:DNA-binding response OmpR family regulator